MKFSDEEKQYITKLKEHSINCFCASSVILKEIHKIINYRMKTDFDLMMPYIFNSAFTIELFFKFLILYDTKLTLNEIKTHNINKLYKTLKNNSKIKYNFLEKINNNYQYEEIKEKDLDYFLIDISNMFVEYRYIFENKENIITTEFGFVNAIMITLFNEVKARNIY